MVVLPCRRSGLFASSPGRCFASLVTSFIVSAVKRTCAPKVSVVKTVTSMLRACGFSAIQASALASSPFSSLYSSSTTVDHGGAARRLRDPHRGSRQGDARRRHEERPPPLLLDEALGQRPRAAPLPRDRRGPRRHPLHPPPRRRPHQRRLPDSRVASGT